MSKIRHIRLADPVQLFKVASLTTMMIWATAIGLRVGTFDAHLLMIGALPLCAWLLIKN